MQGMKAQEEAGHVSQLGWQCPAFCTRQRVQAPAHNSLGLLQRRAPRSCACRTREFDPAAAPTFRMSTIKHRSHLHNLLCAHPLSSLKPLRDSDGRRTAGSRPPLLPFQVSAALLRHGPPSVHGRERSYTASVTTLPWLYTSGENTLANHTS